MTRTETLQGVALGALIMDVFGWLSVLSSFDLCLSDIAYFTIFIISHPSDTQLHSTLPSIPSMAKEATAEIRNLTFDLSCTHCNVVYLIFGSTKNEKGRETEKLFREKTTS